MVRGKVYKPKFNDNRCISRFQRLIKPAALIYLSLPLAVQQQISIEQNKMKGKTSVQLNDEMDES